VRGTFVHSSSAINFHLGDAWSCVHYQDGWRPNVSVVPSNVTVVGSEIRFNVVDDSSGGTQVRLNTIFAAGPNTMTFRRVTRAEFYGKYRKVTRCYAPMTSGCNAECSNLQGL